MAAFDRSELNSRIHRKRVWAYPSIAGKVPVPGIPWPVSRGSYSTKNAKRSQAKSMYGQQSSISQTSYAMKVQRNLSGRAMEQRSTYARKQVENESNAKMKRLLKEKDERQYKSYIGNVNTLNQMKQAFRDLYPSMKNGNPETNKRLAGLIMNYQKDLDDYATSWANVKNFRDQGPDNQDLTQAFGRPFSPANGMEPDVL